MSKFNRALFIFLAVAIVVTLGFIIYLKVVPQKADKFTEFYVLNAEGEAQDYPEQVIAGNPVDILLGVVNHEYQQASYEVYIKMDGIEVGEANIGMLEHNQKWEEKVSFTPQVVGQRQSVDFILYKNGETEPYQKEPLRLYIDVISQ
jgi:uncharacterized membrane protein